MQMKFVPFWYRNLDSDPDPDTANGVPYIYKYTCTKHTVHGTPTGYSHQLITDHLGYSLES